MSVFNEMSHAFIAAKFYEYLVDEFGERGKTAFTHGTIYYASQRGRRMAQRAIRDGKELTFETYCQYGEWKSTEAAKEKDIANKFEITSTSPTYDRNISHCPWRAQFVKMGAEEAGLAYCKYLDSSIAMGFNPDISYTVDLEPLDGRDGEYCVHVVGESMDNKDTTNRPENLIDFDYHCAHSFWSFSEVVVGIFDSTGYKISEKVLEDFSNEYGEEAADIIMSYKDTNFNVTY